MAVTNYVGMQGDLRGEVTNGAMRRYGEDALGSVTATYASSSQQNTYRYKPYGRLLAKAGSAPDLSFLWNGGSGYRATSLNSSDYYVRRRHLSSVLARWNTQDSLWPVESAYVYSLSNPVLLSDPSGLSVNNWASTLTKYLGCPNCGCPPQGIPLYDSKGHAQLGECRCCKGQCKVCVNVPKAIGGWPVTDERIGQCIAAHEAQHCDQLVSGRCQAECRFDLGTRDYSLCGWVYVERNCGECEAYSAELDCVMNSPKGADPFYPNETGDWCAYAQSVCWNLLNTIPTCENPTQAQRDFCYKINHESR